MSYSVILTFYKVGRNTGIGWDPMRIHVVYMDVMGDNRG